MPPLDPEMVRQLIDLLKKTWEENLIGRVANNPKAVFEYHTHLAITHIFRLYRVPEIYWEDANGVTIEPVPGDPSAWTVVWPPRLGHAVAEAVVKLRPPPENNILKNWRIEGEEGLF